MGAISCKPCKPCPECPPQRQCPPQKQCPQRQTCTGAMTEAFRIVQSFVTDVEVERHIGEFVVKSGLSDLAIEQLRSAAYWSLCGWFQTVLLRPGTPALQVGR